MKKRESELTLAICADDPASVEQSLLELPTVADFILGSPRGVYLSDRYFDTADRRISKVGAVFRVRWKDGSAFVTVKGPRRTSQQGVSNRNEIEAPWSRDAFADAVRALSNYGLELSPLRLTPDPDKTMKACGLELQQSRETFRRIREIVSDSTTRNPIAELMIDRVRYEFGKVVVYHHEIELEALNKKGVSVLPVLSRDLQGRYGKVLRVWRLGKFATGRKIERLLEDGRLDHHLFNDALLPSAYALLEESARRSSRRG